MLLMFVSSPERLNSNLGNMQCGEAVIGPFDVFGA